MFNWIFKNRSKERAVAVRSAVWDAAGGGNRLANWAAPSTAFASRMVQRSKCGRCNMLRANPGFQFRASGTLLARSANAYGRTT